MHCRILSSISGLHTLDTNSNVSSPTLWHEKNVPSISQMSPSPGRSQSHTFVKATIIPHLDDRCVPPLLLLFLIYCMRISVDSCCYQIILLPCFKLLDAFWLKAYCLSTDFKALRNSAHLSPTSFSVSLQAHHAARNRGFLSFSWMCPTSFYLWALAHMWPHGLECSSPHLYYKGPLYLSGMRLNITSAERVSLSLLLSENTAPNYL